MQQVQRTLHELVWCVAMTNHGRSPQDLGTWYRKFSYLVGIPCSLLNFLTFVEHPTIYTKCIILCIVCTWLNRTQDQARCRMIDLLKRPPVPMMAKAPPRRPRHEGNASIEGESETDVVVANGDLKEASPVIETDEEVRAFETFGT